MNELDGIKQFTTVVADSGDIESIRHYHPHQSFAVTQSCRIITI